MFGSSVCNTLILTTMKSEFGVINNEEKILYYFTNIAFALVLP